MAIQQSQTPYVQIIRRAFCLLLALAVFAGCEKEREPGYVPPKQASQTVLLYMPGVNLLEFYKQNIDGVCKTKKL